MAELSTERERGAGRGPGREGRLPLAYIVLSLLALVIVPPLWQARVEENRRTIFERLEPARAEIVHALIDFVREAGAVRVYAESGDDTRITAIRTAGDAVPAALANVRRLVATEVPEIRTELDFAEATYADWRAHAEVLLSGRVPTGERDGWIATSDLYGARMISALEEIRLTLISAQDAMRANTYRMGRIGAIVTVVLALMALVSAVIVIHFGRRLARVVTYEREARSLAETRAREERELRNAVGAVAATYTVAEVIQRIADAAVLATGAAGTIVTRIHLDRSELEVVAVAGDRVPRVGLRMDYPGSYAERAVSRGLPDTTDELRHWAGQLPDEIVSPCADCPALLVPLVNSGEAVGTLIVIGERGAGPFRPDQVERAHAFGNLAAIAIRRVHMFEDSEKRREALLRVTESRARLVRGFSHDVKNPLGAADGYLQLLAEGVLGETSPAQAEALGNARRSINAAVRLIDDLLAIARAETSDIEVNWVPTDVGEAARQMGREYRAQAEAKGLALEIETPAELPLIESDASRIRQVLGNLLSNAVKYTERGRIVVRAGIAEGGCPDGGKCVQIEVADTGPGIPPEKQEVIFDEFARADSAGRPGTGVGLAISRRICEALGGSLTVESEPGAGATFRMTLPVARPGARVRVAPRAA
ncbi:MAG TPA: GAF domain-containing sensor histidine kinase [Longimicrobiales bacterium]|nr:GAF domain-containing sensor histidine kinase [Longimicrobiales bacterium]